MIYFDNAATSFPKPKEVATAVCEAINTMGNPNRGIYDISLNASRLVYEVREKISDFFTVGNPYNCVFTGNITDSANAVISTMLKEDDHVITTMFEHNSILRPLYKKKCEISFIEIIKEDNVGLFDYSSLKSLLKTNTKAVICNHSSNVLGNIINTKLIGEFCRENNLLFILDTAQTAGFLPINMQEENIDVLMYTGHKSLLGPQGVGGFCLSAKALKFIEPYKVGGSGSHSFLREHPREMPTCYEAGTLNTPSIMGLNAGIDYVLDKGISNIARIELDLAKKFYEGIKNCENITIYGINEYESYENCRTTPIVAFNISDYDSADVTQELYERYDIASRSGVHCSPLTHEFMGTEKQGMVRFSFSSFNTNEEVDIAIDGVRSL